MRNRGLVKINLTALAVRLTALLALLPSFAQAQISAAVVTDRILIQLSSDGTYSHSVSSGACSTPDCSLSITLVDTNGPYYEGAGAASKTNISGNLRRFYNDMNVNGSNDVESTSKIYAKVPPGQPVVIKVPASAQVAWNNMSYVYGGPILTAWAVAELKNPQMTVTDSTGCSSNVSLPASSDSQSKTLTLETTAAGETVVIGEETYYLVGHINLRGRIHIRRYGSPSPDASFGASVGPVEVRYKGKVLNYEGGGNQTWLTGQPLPAPLAVKVIQDDTGQPAAGETVTFTVQEPVNDATLSEGTVTTDSYGIARTTLTLGTVSGPYTVKATCASCVSGVAMVDFTSTAQTMEQGRELWGDICDLHGALNQQLSPFRVRVYNSITTGYETGVDVSYKWISFTGTNGVTYNIPDSRAPKMTKINPSATKTRPDGFSSTSLTLGEIEGIYTVQALCDSCLAQKEVICRGYAHIKQIIAETEENESANPYDRDETTGEILTPVLIVTEAIAPNDYKSFTTDPAENFLRLKAELLPEELDSAAIEWEIKDAPDDFMDSGALVPTRTGPETETYVKAPQVPAAPTGRPLPLSYRAQAKAVINGKEVYSRYQPLKQDEIDKCRQEYLDFEIGLAQVPRSTFTLGLDGEFVGKALDCYAHIYPERAGEVLALGETNTIRINSGYRSPRANLFIAKSKAIKTSWHMFGKAVDIEVLPETALNYQNLWGDVGCPKLLESAGGILLRCDENENITGLLQYVDAQGNLRNLNGNSTYDAFETLSRSGWLHMGR